MRKLVCLLVWFALALPALASDQKLIALTFDDGPRPYVLYGRKDLQPPAPGLLDLLDQYKAKGTFFVMGWRLTPKTWGERHETNVGITCLDAARDVLRRGHEIENHTYGHESLKLIERRRGEAAALADVEHGGAVINAVSGKPPHYLRPPLWQVTPEIRRDLQSHGYRVLTIYAGDPVALRDVNTLDYLCAGTHPVNCPKPSLAASVLRQVEQREKHGSYTHILVFHELSTTVTALQTLLPELQRRDYRFVRLDDYMRQVSDTHQTAARTSSSAVHAGTQ